MPDSVTNVTHSWLNQDTGISKFFDVYMTFCIDSWEPSSQTCLEIPLTKTWFVCATDTSIVRDTIIKYRVLAASMRNLVQSILRVDGLSLGRTRRDNITQVDGRAISFTKRRFALYGKVVKPMRDTLGEEKKDRGREQRPPESAETQRRWWSANPF